MMDTLLCLIYLHANTFTPIYTCLKIQFLKICDTWTRIRFSDRVWMPPGTRNFWVSGSSPGCALLRGALLYDAKCL